MQLLISIIYIAFIGILAHYIGEALPRNIFKAEKFPFKLYKWEKNGRVYEYIWVRKWKTKLPDMSRYMKDMLPKRVDIKSNSKNIDALIKETCVAEFIHKILVILSVGVYFIWKKPIGIFLAFICILFNIPFIIIQRYNRPNLIRLRNKMIYREEKRKNAVSDIVL